jgi:hypothetical protein
MCSLAKAITVGWLRYCTVRVTFASSGRRGKSSSMRVRAAALLEVSDA